MSDCASLISNQDFYCWVFKFLLIPLLNIRRTFSNAQIYWCRIHLVQLWYHKTTFVKRLHIKKSVVKIICWGLLLLQPNEIANAFCDLISIGPPAAKRRGLFRFRSTKLYRRRLKIPSQNVGSRPFCYGICEDRKCSWKLSWPL